MTSFARQVPKRYADHPLPDAPEARTSFIRQVPSRPARVLFDDPEFAVQRHALAKRGVGGRVYRIHDLGDGEWRLFEIPSGREFVVRLERKPRRRTILETWFERGPSGWGGKYR